MKAVIMAGGRGTRISDVAKNIPKPLINIKGKPILEYEIECLSRQGFDDIIITVGYLGDKIIEYFKDGYSLGVNIEYYNETIPLGNAGALYEIKDSLTDEFLLLNADVIFDIDLQRFVSYHHEKGGLATLFSHPNDHPYDSGLLLTALDGSVKEWLNPEDKRPRWYKNRVNAGIHILSKELLKERPNTDKVDLDRQLLKPLVETGKLFVYDSPEYVKDMGTPVRLNQVTRDIELKLVRNKNLQKKQRAVFLDRDGTINKYVGFLTDIEDFELLPGAAEAIRKINNLGHLAIVVTNQPVIARGEVTIDKLKTIHDKMETLLGLEGAYVDAIYYCPHHPNKGFEGEIEALKKKCDCRKPKPGMLLKAAEDFNIDLSKSWMVGDSKRDIQTAINSGCNSVLLGHEEYCQTYSVNNLLEAVDHIEKTFYSTNV